MIVEMVRVQRWWELLMVMGNRGAHGGSAQWVIVERMVVRRTSSSPARPFSAKRARSFAISSLSFFIIMTLGSSLTVAWFTMRLALFAYLHEGKGMWSMVGYVWQNGGRASCQWL